MHVRRAAPRDSRRVRRRDGLAQRASAGLLLDGRLVDRLLRLREGDRRRQSEPDPLVIHRGVAGHAIVPGRPLDVFGVAYYYFYDLSKELCCGQSMWCPNA
jgi:hypothetical protein